MVTYNRTIRLKGVGRRIERPAGAAITPGHLIELTTANKFVVHSAANAKTAAIFALENELIGLGIDDNYAANDLVQAEHFKPNDWVNALVAASATAIAIGDYLESAGDGTLRLSGSQYTGELGSIAQAMEAVDNSAGITPARIKVAIV
jgi:hypothetical protein